MRRLLVTIAILMLVPGVAYAGGGHVDATGCAGYSEGTEVGMLDSCFAGTAHFAPDDTTITVSNDGALPHTLTAVDGSFDTGLLESGESAELSFEEPGIYRVFCELHGTAAGEGMAGVVVVGEPAPAAVAASLDLTGPATGEIQSAQADGLGSSDGAVSPQVIAVPADVGAERLVVLIMVGLAAGIALASLLTVLRLRIAGRPAKGD